jgi:hypothetical protein
VRPGARAYRGSMNAQMMYEMAQQRAADARRTAERQRTIRAAREASEAADGPVDGRPRLRRLRARLAGA